MTSELLRRAGSAILPNRLRVIASIEARTITGPAKNLMRFCRYARNRPDGCDISLVTYLRTGSDRNEFLDAAEACRVPVHVIRERHAFDTNVLSSLRELFKRERPDIVQTHAVKSHVLVKLARPSPTCWIAYHHGYTYPDLKMRLYNELDRWSLRSADRVITVCEVFRQELTNLGVKPDRIRVLGNCIEPREPPLQTATELRQRPENSSNRSRSGCNRAIVAREGASTLAGCAVTARECERLPAACGRGSGT